jgi:glycosyltransferase involved in cell wall biosynthesis
MPQPSAISDPVSPANTAEASWHMDARIASALAWAEKQGLGGITLAIPFVVSNTTLNALTRRRDIHSLIVDNLNHAAINSDVAGTFSPMEYSWTLPQRVSRRILLIGTRSNLSARMIKASLLRGIREIGYWDIDRWVLRSTTLLAIEKVRAKLFAYLQLGAERFFGKGTLMLSSFEGIYRRRFRHAIEGESSIERIEPVRGRVVFVCPTLVAGGAERQIVNTVVGLRRRGITDMTVLVGHLFSRPGHDFFLKPLHDAGVHVRQINGALDSEAEWERYTNSAKEIHQIGRARALLSGLPAGLIQDVINHFSMLREIRPELVHSWLDYSNVRAGYAAILAGIPRILISGRNVSPIHFPYILEPHMRAAYQGLATRPEITFVNNSTEGAEDYAAWVGLPASRFRVIRNGIDLAWTRRADPDAVADFRHAHGVPATGSLVGSMFRFSGEKRPLLWLQTAVELTSRHSDVYCLLFGEGPLRPEMERYLAELKVGDRIRLAAPTPHNLLALSAFDVLLLTSQWEGTPNVAIEAQAVGTPVVATGGGGTRETLQDGVTGLFIDQPSPVRLATAVSTLLSEREQWLAMSEAGPRFVSERFGLERMIRETLEIYDFAGRLEGL